MLEVVEAKQHARSYPKTSYDRRSFNSKPRLYVHAEGETIMENLLYRTNRPAKLYKEVLPRIFEMVGISPDTKAVWSWKAGCSCGCSPGFILTDTGVTAVQCDYFATVKAEDPQVAKVAQTEEAQLDALSRFQQLDNQGIVDILTKPVADPCGTGRGDAGNLRNFKQMSDKKFFGVLADVLAENDDDEAIAAVKVEAARRAQ